MELQLDGAFQRLKALAEVPALQQISAALGRDGDLHLVGGTVRDTLLGKEGVDLDLATALPPERVRELLEKRGIHVVPTGLKHQTVTAVIDGQHIELTTFRGPGMRPEGGVVHGISIEEDLLYRDFTINALAYSLDEGVLIDPLNGIQDLRKEKVRTCGSPSERFEEDPLRLLRFIRFAVQLRFSIDEKSGKAAQALGPSLKKVSVERIRDELVKILLSPEPTRGFIILNELGFLEYVLPELIPAVGCDQNRFHSKDVFLHTLDVVERTQPELVLRLAALFHDIGKPHTISIDPLTGERHFFKHESVGAEITRETMKRLRFSNEQQEAVALLVQTHMRPIEAGAPGLRRLLRDTGEHYQTWRLLKEADTLATKVDPIDFRRALDDFDMRMEEVMKGPPVSPLASLALKGRDLLENGYPESPQIGVILRALHERVLDDPSLNTKEALLSLAKELFPLP